MQPFAYIGPGGGVTVGALLVILIGGLVLFALGFIVWLRIKRFLRGQGKAKWGLKLLTQAVALLAVLSVFGWMAKHRAKKDRDFGAFNGVVELLSGFPDQFKQSVEEVQTLPQTFVPTPVDFSPVNRLEEDVLTLTAYSDAQDGRTISVRNLRDGQELHRWTVSSEIGPLKPHWRIHHPLLLEDRSVVSFITNRSPLFRLDSVSNVMWRQDSLSFHHAINRAADGSLWACTMRWERGGRHIAYRGRYRMGDRTVHFLDNSVARIDPETGHILEVHSMAEVLRDNELDHLILRSGDAQDPLHLNDVEPVLTPSDHMEVGDLFLSFRNLQCVLQFRPSTGEIIRVIDGPLAAQHDVDIVNDSTLVIFNNNVQENNGVYINRAHNYPVSKDEVEVAQYHSQITVFDLVSGSFTPLYPELMAEQGIMTSSEGLQEALPDGRWFLEEQNSGELWVVGPEGVLYHDVHRSHHDGHHHLPNWTRVLSAFP